MSGCRGPKETLATVGDQTITADDLRREYRLGRPYAQDGPSMLDRKWLLKTLIRRKLLALDAHRNGGFQVESSSPVLQAVDAVDSVNGDAVIASRYEKWFADKARPSDSMILTYYERRLAYYTQPMETGHQVFAQTMEKAQKAQALLAQGISFEEVAWQLTGSKQRFPWDRSEISPFRKGDRIPPFEKIFFALRPGQISGIVPVANGFAIIQRGEPRGDVSYEDIQNEIRQLLPRIAVEEKVRALTASTQITIDDKKLADMDFPPPKS